MADEKNKNKWGGNWQDWSKSFNFGGTRGGNATDPDRNDRDFVEEIKVNGKNLVGEVEKLLREGQVRQLRIRYRERILLDLPVTWAVVGAVIAPQLAAVAAIAGVVVGDCTIEVIRKPTAIVKSEATSAEKPNIPPTPDDLKYR